MMPSVLSGRYGILRDDLLILVRYGQGSGACVVWTRRQGPEVAAWEAEIAPRMTRLYGLTADERTSLPASLDIAGEATLCEP